MTEIYVDADACPVKEEVMRVGGRHGLRMHFVANSWMRLPRDELINQVIVTDGFDAADNWIHEHITGEDICITADIPLAARCLGQGARVIGPTGRPFTPDNIGSAVAMRELMGQLRDMGTVPGYNAAFTRQDRSRFLQALEQAVQDIRRARG
jgi:uncharacterized protein YaiI (UPF0178 family)